MALIHRRTYLTYRRRPDLLFLRFSSMVWIQSTDLPILLCSSSYHTHSVLMSWLLSDLWFRFLKISACCLSAEWWKWQRNRRKGQETNQQHVSHRHRATGTNSDTELERSSTKGSTFKKKSKSASTGSYGAWRAGLTTLSNLLSVINQSLMWEELMHKWTIFKDLWHLYQIY